MTTQLSAAYLCAAAMTFALGCLDDIGDEPTTSSVNQPLFQRGGLWNTDRVDGFGTSWRANTVPVCFETGLDDVFGTGYDGDSSSVANFESMKVLLREAVEDSWGRVANLRFVHWGTCPSRNHDQLAGWVTIFWREGPTGCGAGWPAGQSCNPQTNIGYIPDEWTRMGLNRFTGTFGQLADEQFKAVARHEMGHALGFDHEKDRPDYSGSPGTNCSAVTPRPSGTVWTEVYDPASIMNYTYCAEANGELSPYDVYGVQRAYGRKHSKAIVGYNGRCVNTPGFNYTNGTGLQLYDCYGQSNDTWSRGYSNGYQIIGQMSSPYTVSVWSTRVPRPTHGNWVELQSYSGNNLVNVWKLTGVQWRAIGDMCVAVRNPAAGDTRLIIAKCDPTDTRQRWDWDYGVQGRIRNVATGTCANVAYASNANNTPINTYPCGSPNPWSNEVFTTTSRGEIKWGGKCLNVANYYPVPGAELQLYDCAPAGTPNASLWYNELFYLHGPITEGWYGNVVNASGSLWNGAGLFTSEYAYWDKLQAWDVYF
jgi:hypothetical protein